jgi:toxin ParE1/3/4
MQENDSPLKINHNMLFTIVIDTGAIQDIQKAIDYYEQQQNGLGRKFENELNKYLIALKTNPFFRIRYDNVRCLPLKKYPYLIHYSVYEEKNILIVHAVFHSSLSTQNWLRRRAGK